MHLHSRRPVIDKIDPRVNTCNDLDGPRIHEAKKQIQNASHYMIRLRLPEKDKAVRMEIRSVFVRDKGMVDHKPTRQILGSEEICFDFRYESL